MRPRKKVSPPDPEPEFPIFDTAQDETGQQVVLVPFGGRFAVSGEPAADRVRRGAVRIVTQR